MSPVHPAEPAAKTSCHTRKNWTTASLVDDSMQSYNVFVTPASKFLASASRQQGQQALFNQDKFWTVSCLKLK